MFIQWRKKRARARALSARQAAYERAPQAGRELAAHIPDAIWPALHSVVAGYRPIRHEIDPTPLMETFYCEQARLCLPCVTDKDGPLTFKGWSPGDRLVEGAFGISEPEPSMAEVKPSLILVPLLAFDETGHRLGYGGGYYDRTLEALRQHHPVIAVGLAYEAQRVRKLPYGRHDMALDWVITEERAYRGQI